MMATINIVVTPHDVTTIGADQHLVLSLPSGVEEPAAQAIGEQLQRALPGVTFTIVIGGDTSKIYDEDAMRRAGWVRADA